jgi:hypothetical protein
MNRDDDFIGQLEDYLESFDGVTPLPGRVRDAVQADLPLTRQVRPARGMGRVLNMVSQASTGARMGLAAAVVVAAVVLGAAVMNNGRVSQGIGSVPATASPSPSTSVSPSTSTPPTPSPAPVPPAPLGNTQLQACPADVAQQCIVPGTYRLTSTTAWPGQITIDVPAGWFQWQPAADIEGVLVDNRSDDSGGSGWGVMFAAVGPLFTDPCDLAKGTIDSATTSTVDGLVAAMSKWPGFTATAPTPTMVDGFSGKLITLTSTLTTGTKCPAPALWTTPLGAKLDAYPMVTSDKTPHPGQFRIIDVNGTLLVIRTTDFPGTSPNEAAQGVAPNPTRHAADQVELHQILDSIKVTAP